MNQDIVIGLLSVGFGVVTLVLRVVAPWKLGKMEAMRKRFGAALGTLLHVAAYTMAPLAVGTALLVRGFGC